MLTLCRSSYYSTRINSTLVIVIAINRYNIAKTSSDITELRIARISVVALYWIVLTYYRSTSVVTYIDTAWIWVVTADRRAFANTIRGIASKRMTRVRCSACYSIVMTYCISIWYCTVVGGACIRIFAINRY